MIIAADRATAARLHERRDGGPFLSFIMEPASDEPEALRSVIRSAVDTIGSMPGGDEHLQLAYVTNFYSNRQNENPAIDLLSRYAKYYPALLDRVHFVIVDDGSPIEYQLPDFDLNLTWIRIDQDIPWNTSGGRNLGMLYARADNVFMTDMDIEVPELTLAYFARRAPCGRWMYRPMRRNAATGAEIGRHPNVS
jgi:hypothetical protein